MTSSILNQSFNNQNNQYVEEDLDNLITPILTDEKRVNYSIFI